MLAIYSITLFVSAILLFTLEPMVGKMLLPKCGGTPAVWNTCMVFYQVVLLLGYAYAHVSTSLLKVRRQAAFHLAVLVLPLLVLPIAFRANAVPPSEQNPSLWLLAQLTLVVGLPFFAVSTTAPLLQRWFVNTGHEGSSDPYFLYSTSNAGSLLALVSYPFLIEPLIGLATQAYVWTACYAILIGLIACCAAAMWMACRKRAGEASVAPDNTSCPSERLGDDQAPAAGRPISLRRRLSWIMLALIPSSLMLGVTTHISTDIAAVPLLWIIPLVLYLLSFVIVFARRPLVPHWLMISAMPYAVLLMPLLAFRHTMKFWITIPVHLLTFFIVAMVCHGELARTRPEAKRLTEFYLWMSLGGVLGGMFNSLLAPQIFTYVVEYPLMLVAACFFRPAGQSGEKRGEFDFRDGLWITGLAAAALVMIELTSRILAPGGFVAEYTRRYENLDTVLGCVLVYGVPAIMCFSFRGRRVRFALGTAVLFVAVGLYTNGQSGDILFAVRDFYGVNRVCVLKGRDKCDRYHALVNGNIIHGLQEMYPTPKCRPIGYYYSNGPLCDVTYAFDQSKPNRRVGIIGLGTGSIAAFASPGQHFTFYEIDPAVIRIASDDCFFTFLKECKGKCEVVPGDARIRLADAPDGQYDTIILDAFSSDSIPMHLLTREALQLYCSKLKDDGILVLHVTNRYLNLEPVLAVLAEKNNLVCLSRSDYELTEEEKLDYKYPARYMVMARHKADLGNLNENPKWSRPEILAGVHEWTDDYTNILSVLYW
jgi:hypothetical protein